MRTSIAERLLYCLFYQFGFRALMQAQNAHKFLDPSTRLPTSRAVGAGVDGRILATLASIGVRDEHTQRLLGAVRATRDSAEGRTHPAHARNSVHAEPARFHQRAPVPQKDKL